MFELTEKTKGKLIELIVLSQKNRKDTDKPGGKFTVEVTLSNHLLAYFDGHLKGAMYAAPQGGDSGQKSIETVTPVSDMPSLSNIGAKLGTVAWHQDFSGYNWVIDHGTGGKRNIDIDDCKLSGFKFTFKEGGTFVCKFDIESENVAEAQFGRMAMFKSRDIEFTLMPPEMEQGDLEK